MYFLSEESVFEHKAYLANLKLKYSILEKSIPSVKGRTLEEIYKLRLSKAERRELTELYCEIRLHELFFTSFSEHRGIPSQYIEKKYSGCAAFLHELSTEAKRLSFGFVCYCVSHKEGVVISSRNYEEIFACGEPIIAIDVFEHAYFRDFGFDKGSYIRAALSALDLSRIDKFVFG